MRVTTRFRRLGLAASALALSLTLGACESFDLADLFPDGKKKIPGERRPVFPEGVPGVDQGIPPELMKGTQPGELPPTATMTTPQQSQQQQPQQQAEEEPKPAPKPKRAAARSKPTPTVAPEVQQQRSQPAQTSPWPSSQPSQQQSAWPAAPQPGTFSQ